MKHLTVPYLHLSRRFFSFSFLIRLSLMCCSCCCCRPVRPCLCVRAKRGKIKTGDGKMRRHRDQMRVNEKKTQIWKMKTKKLVKFRIKLPHLSKTAGGKGDETCGRHRERPGGRCWVAKITINLQCPVCPPDGCARLSVTSSANVASSGNNNNTQLTVKFIYNFFSLSDVVIFIPALRFLV